MYSSSLTNWLKQTVLGDMTESEISLVCDAVIRCFGHYIDSKTRHVINITLLNGRRGLTINIIIVLLYRILDDIRLGWLF